MRITTNGTGGLAVQIGHRLKEAAAEVREDWEDFVAEARAERERRQAANGDGAGTAKPSSSRRAGQRRGGRGASPRNRRAE
jgi:uncharacterized protein DUF5132